MNSSDIRALTRQLLREEIERIIAEAESAGTVVRAGYHAGQLLQAYAAADFSLGRIVDEIILAATKARVPIEISRSE